MDQRDGASGVGACAGAEPGAVTAALSGLTAENAPPASNPRPAEARRFCDDRDFAHYEVTGQSFQLVTAVEQLTGESLLKFGTTGG